MFLFDSAVKGGKCSIDLLCIIDGFGLVVVVNERFDFGRHSAVVFKLDLLRYPLLRHKEYEFSNCCASRSILERALFIHNSRNVASNRNIFAHIQMTPSRNPIRRIRLYILKFDFMKKKLNVIARCF